MQRRRLWRIAAVTLLGLCAGWTAMALLCVRIAGRMVAAIEQLNGVAMAMNTAHAAPPPPVCDRPPAPPSPPPPPSPAPPVGPRWPVGLGIFKLGPTNFLVDRRLLDMVADEQAVIMRQPRVVPDVEAGKVVGLRLFGVRPDSLLGHLGIENGDRVQSVNGIALDTPEKALEMYARLQNAAKLFVTVNRRGSTLLLEYHLV
jgi:general secretion pathway protein C